MSTSSSASVIVTLLGKGKVRVRGRRLSLIQGDILVKCEDQVDPKKLRKTMLLPLYPRIVIDGDVVIVYEGKQTTIGSIGATGSSNQMNIF